MLPQGFRLSKSQTIQLVLKKGRYKHVGSLFLAKWLPNKKLNHRITIVASSKISKRAVDRNKIRRVLTNNLPANLLQGSKNYDIVVVVKKGILESLSEAHDAFIAILTNLSDDKKNVKKN